MTHSVGTNNDLPSLYLSLRITYMGEFRFIHKSLLVNNVREELQ